MLSWLLCFVYLINLLPDRVAFKMHFCLRKSSIITGGRVFASSRSIILALILLTILMLMISLQSLETLIHSIKLWLLVSTLEMHGVL